MASRSLFSRFLGRTEPEAPAHETEPASEINGGASAVPAEEMVDDGIGDDAERPEAVVGPADPVAPGNAPIGIVETLDPDGASGWVYDPSRPGVPLDVAAFVGTRCIGLARAASYRAELEASIGHGAHGFNLTFSPSLAPALAGHVTFVSVSDGRPSILQAHDPARAAEALASDEGTAPVFIFGTAPGVADLLAHWLIQDAGFAGPVRGQLLPLAQQLTRTLRQFYRTGLPSAGRDAMIRQIEPPVFRRALKQMFVDVMAQQYPHGDWIDNSPGVAAIHAAPLLRTIWPKARFIFVGSRVLESIVERETADPERSPRDRAAQWAREMAAWAEVRVKLRNAHLVVDARRLMEEPREAGQAIAKFLKRDEAADAALADRLREAVQAHEPPKPEVDISSWDTREVEAVKAAAGPMMALFGYDWGEAYFAPNDGTASSNAVSRPHKPATR